MLRDDKLLLAMRLAQILAELGENQLDELSITYKKSVTNFVLIKFPKSEKLNAKKAESFFSERGILVRSMDAYNLPEYIRVSLGKTDENKTFINNLKEFLVI